jgi:hypothetical protein
MILFQSCVIEAAAWILPVHQANPDYLVSEVADWSEEKLYQIIEAVTGGLVRKSA